MAELMLGQPLFPGESGIDQLVEIIKVLGTPSREQIKTMNPNYMEHKFPQIKPHPFQKVSFRVLPLARIAQPLTERPPCPTGLPAAYRPRGDRPGREAARVHARGATQLSRGHVPPFLRRTQAGGRQDAERERVPAAVRLHSGG